MKIAIIGAGVIGELHAKILASSEHGLSAICDEKKERAERLAALYAPDAKVYTDWKKTIDELMPDAVHICTPHNKHAEMVIYALGRGVNVLCEKPLCINADELLAILDAERRSAATLGVCLQNRYNGSFAFAKEYLKDKKVIMAHANVCWNRGKSYYDESPWRGRLCEAGGGVLINQAMHTLDLLADLCGMPSAVSARADVLCPKEGVEVEDTVCALFEGEVGFTFFATVNASRNLPVEINLRLDNGEQMILLPKSVIVNGASVFDEKESQAELGKSYYGGSHGKLFDDFYRALAAGEPFAVDGTEASKIMKLILAVYSSNAQKIKI